MLIIDCREYDSIDKALKRYKKKFEKSGTLKQLRNRKTYTKPTVERRTVKLKAAYRLKMQNKYA